MKQESSKQFNSDTAVVARETQGKKSWNSTTEEQRLGFALRDEMITNSMPTPMVVPKLGYPYQRMLGRTDSFSAGIANESSQAQWRINPGQGFYWANIGATAGIMTLDVEHVFAQRDSIAQSETKDIFINKWTEMRILNNMVRNFQPQDLQFMWCGLMEIRAHIANLRRILNVMKTVNTHQLNEYYNPERMMASLGFPMTETQMRQNYQFFWQRFNNSILDKLANVRWLTGMVPGEKRWAGLYSEIYKDEYAYTDYTQLYILRPRRIWDLVSAYDPNVSAYAWTFIPSDYMSEDTGASGISAFGLYLDKVAGLIRHVFFDDGAADIIATINAIAEKTNSDQVTSEYLTYERLPFEGEEVKLTYDVNMLLAIHNATVLPLDPGVPTQDIANATLEQYVTAVEPIGRLAHRMSKIIDLPNFAATTADMINASQWTISTLSVHDSHSASDPDDVTLTVDSVGTDYLCRAKIWYIDYTQLSDSDPNWNIIGYGAIDLNDENLLFSTDAWFTTLAYGIPAHSPGRYGYLMNFKNAFAFAPLSYWMNSDQSDATHPQHVSAVSGQMEVMYDAAWDTLSWIHRQFKRNFWGYPVAGANAETFRTSYHEASVSD